MEKDTAPLKRLLFLLAWTMLVILPRNLNGQGIEGTLIIMAVCRDGIIVCTDSRGVIKDKSVDQVYMDAMDKSAIIGSNVLAVFNRSMVKDEFFFTFLKKLPKSKISDQPVQQLANIRFFLMNNVDEQEFEILKKKTGVFMAGFTKDKPNICWLNLHNWGGVTCNEYFQSNYMIDSSIMDSIHNTSMKQAINIVEGIFKKAESNHIGGPIKIITIDNKTKKPRCIRNCDISQEDSLIQTYKNLLNNKLKFTLIPPIDSSTFFQFLTDQIIRLDARN